MPGVKRMLVLAAAAAVLCSAMESSALATSSPVLPPGARPLGWSLERMTGALALFTASGNKPANYPDTPFQILYVKDGAFKSEALGDGLRITGSSTFTVPPGTKFFVPMFNADDSPPLPPGPYPESPAEAVPYVFDRDHYGASGWEITVDGQSTPIGAEYLAGPVTTPELPDGGGTHMITLGAFLHPLTPGTHTVTVSGGLFGNAIRQLLGLAFIVDEFTYTVIVE
jgi:hypothetical protein